jgi:hypothetical protein
MTDVLFSAKHFLGLVGFMAVAGSSLAAPALAQDKPLTERMTYINGCRRINQTSEVFNNSNLGPLSTRVGTLTAGTNITLTGVLAPGRAQIVLPGSDRTIQVLGWVDAAHLGPCSSNVVTPPPSGQTGICYRVNTDMIARTSPSTQAGIDGYFNAGDTTRSTTNPPTVRVSPNSAPDYGRRWVQVETFDGNGWVSQTGFYGQGSNLTQVATNQCR